MRLIFFVFILAMTLNANTKIDENFNDGNKSVMSIIKETLRQNTQNQIISTIFTKTVAYLQENTKELAQIKYLKAKEYHNRLLFHEAKKQMHKAVVLDEGNQHYNHWYAYILKDLGEYDDALKYYRTSLALQQKATPNPTTDTAATCNNIGGVYASIGEYDKALEYYQKALAIQEKVLGDEHPLTAQSHNNIAEAYGVKGELNKALEYHQKALAIREKILGGEHQDTAQSYNNIAGIYHVKKEQDKALGYYQKALAIREKVLGVEHPLTAQSYNNIAWLHYEMQQYQEALNWMQKAVDIREKVLPANHPWLIGSKEGLGMIKAKL